MSIYIAITMLEDSDIVGTVATAISNAQSHEIRIGLVMAVSDEFYDKIQHRISYPQVTVKRVPLEDVKGIGKARRLSYFNYSNEDYAIQVDSHTFFDKGWDVFLANLFEESVIATGNRRVVLSANIADYTVVNGRAIVTDSMTEYATYTPSWWSQHMSLPYWTMRKLRDFPDGSRYEGVRLVPLNKICGQFVFSNGDYIKSNSLPPAAIYVDEEIIQTINLLEQGFAMVFPNMELPVAHRHNYTQKVERQDGKSLFWSDDPIVPELLISANMYDFIENNDEACDRYTEFAKCNIKSGLVKPFYVPQSFGYPA